MEDVGLEFPLDTAGEHDGLGDAGIETFRDSAYASCAREAGQNSRDAAVSNSSPVRVAFNLLHIPTSEFPAKSRLEIALKACLKEAHEEKEVDFFTNALAVLNKDTVPVLHIADYSTLGLIGPPNEKGTPFHSLLKARGVTNKQDNETSAGSFGIGKNAVMAVSDLQTVFYSTLYKTTETEEFAAQGKVILVSHKGPDGLDRRPSGYWGHWTDFSAVTSQDEVPEWMKRSQIGTSIFCMGFREGDGSWEDLMICSLISNFFGAICQKQMEFEVGSQIINSTTLESLLSSESLRKSAEGTDLEDELSFARSLHRCLVSGNSVIQDIDIENLGKIRVRILADKGLPRRLGFVRNGMLITDNLSYFGHKFQKFPAAKDFICLVEPADSAAGKVLKTLENPKHKDFSADRISDPHKRASAVKAMRTLGTKLRDMINSTAGAKIEGSVVVDELASLFAIDESASPNESSGGLDPERFIYKVPPKTSKKSGPGGGAGVAGKGSKGGKGGGGNSTNPSGKGTGKGGAGGVGNRRPIELKNVRNHLGTSSLSKGRSRTIYFSSDTSGAIEVSIFALGLNSPDALNIINSSRGLAKNGKVTLEIMDADRQELTVLFNEPYEGPIEIIASKKNDAESQA
ncbi:hypothetical protein [Stutzerimonas stutzeri]|uniref:hypothetical protein n=1 Tax=Stutzerimonas stutzeri TaxID=316 RepID=UPI00101AE178|nr:hypothetical protein [Stutzerimonas stutzeri]